MIVDDPYSGCSQPPCACGADEDADAHAVINLILHQVPQYCHLSVDGQFHLWFHGKCLIFDDFLLHSAHNETLDDEDSTRVVLLLDFWHPSIDESVKPLLSHIFQRSAD